MDTQIGESREIFAISVSVSTVSGLMASAGSRPEAIVVINDVPGMQQCC